MSKQKREREKNKKGPWFGVAVRKALQKTHSYSTKACAEESCTNPTTTAAWHCFRGGNFTAYRQTFEMLSLCSAALWRRFQEEADRRPGHNAELLDSSTKISGKPNLQQKRFPLPINAYTCPALPTFQAVLIFQERDFGNLPDHLEHLAARRKISVFVRKICFLV